MWKFQTFSGTPSNPLAGLILTVSPLYFGKPFATSLSALPAYFVMYFSSLGDSMRCRATSSPPCLARARNTSTGGADIGLYVCDLLFLILLKGTHTQRAVYAPPAEGRRAGRTPGQRP